MPPLESLYLRPLLLGLLAALPAAWTATGHAAGRIVAIGDLHGDLEAARAALRLAGAIDDQERWVGGDLVVVQTGDILDRGDDDVAMVFYLDDLEGAAARAGGRLVLLNGNHELINAAGDFRYVSTGAFSACRGLLSPTPNARELTDDDVRIACFGPGGLLARRLATRDTIAIVGDTVFVHGGILPEHVAYGIDRFNREVGGWLAGGSGPPSWLQSRQNPVWYRGYSDGIPAPETCDTLQQALDLLGAKRMVVGHTIQQQINSACDGRIWRIDVGMSAHFGGPIEVLEIRGDRVRRLVERPRE